MNTTTREANSMTNADRAGSRWKHFRLRGLTPSDTHLTEKADRIQQVRRRRLLDDLSLIGQTRARGGDLLGALRCYEDALRIDGDSYHAWMGLSVVFMKINDTARAQRCLGVARLLRKTEPGSEHATA
jgi:Tfp pilus assembly protein PilF